MKKLLLALAIGLLSIPASAQVTNPSFLPGCVYNATPPTLADRQQTVWQCDINGKLITSGGGGNAAAVIGPTGAPTPGTVTDNAIVRWDGTTGALVQNSLGILSDIGVLTGVTNATIATGTITTSQPLTLTQGWNAAGVTFTGLKVNITDTASAAGSLLQDWQVASASVAKIGKDGIGYFGPTASQLRVGLAGFLIEGYAGATRNAYLQLAAGVKLNSAVGGNSIFLETTSTGNVGVTTGLNSAYVAADAADTLALRNGVNAQSFRVYNSFTDASNDSWGTMNFVDVANVLTIGTKSNGSGIGVPVKMQFVIEGVNKLDFAVTTAATWRAAVTVSAPTLDTDGFTVAGLPAGVTGMRAYVNDQMTVCPAITGTFTGGGAIVCSAFYNGTAWVHE